MKEVLSAPSDMIKVYANVDYRHFIFISYAGVLRLRIML